jgi:hypothetical protein
MNIKFSTSLQIAFILNCYVQYSVSSVEERYKCDRPIAVVEQRACVARLAESERSEEL